MVQQNRKIKKRKRRENQNLTPEFCILHKDSPPESMTTIPPNIALNQNLSSGYWKDIFKQSKNGPLRVHRMNSKLRNPKLTGRRMMNNEERRRTFTELITKTPRKHYESASTLIFFTETIFLSN